MTVAHASLTGAELHEPKGIETAAVGQVYVANGSSSGAWTSIDATAFTGMIADFVAPIAPSGWLELDGSTISTTTYANLYAVMSIQQTGTRTSGSPTITSLSSTTNIKVGYYVFGTGITSGTTVLSVDSATQITLSANATSSGSNTVVVSPWLLNTGTIKLPDLATAGRYRRSRTPGQAIGIAQADSIASHLHAVNITSGNQSANHAHSGTTNFESNDHVHSTGVGGTASISAGAGGLQVVQPGTNNTGGASANHNHGFATGIENAAHTHSVSGNTGSTGSTETRPISMVFITCVKT